MYKYMLFVLCFLSVSLTAENDKDYVVVSGKINNIDEVRGIEDVNIGLWTNKDISPYKWFPIDWNGVDDEGFFKDTILNSFNNEYSLWISNTENTYLKKNLYVKRGEDIHIEIEDFNSIKVFYNKRRIKDKYMSKRDELFAKTATYPYWVEEGYEPSSFDELYNVFLEKEEELFSGLEELLAKYRRKYFFKQEKLDLKYISWNRKFRFMISTKNLYDLDNPHTHIYEDFLDEIPVINEGQYLNSKECKNVLISFLEEYVRSGYVANNERLFNKLRTVKSKEMKSDIVKLIREESLISTYENMDIYFDFLLDYIEGDKEKEGLLKQYKKEIVLRKGDPFPNFELENIEGGTTSLSDFKGKYVLVDFWFTRCMPCTQSFPALRQVIHDFRDKNIAFINISVDNKSDYEKWKKDVVSLGMIDVVENLIIKNWTKEGEELLDNLNINYYPRYFLIGPDGRIIDPYAPSPLSLGDKLYKLLNKYL